MRKIADIIKDTDEYLDGCLSGKPKLLEAERQQTIGAIEEGILDGSYDQLEGAIMLSLMGAKEIEAITGDQLRINLRSYPEAKEIDELLAKAKETIASPEAAFEKVASDLVEAYRKKGIDLEELVAKLTSLGIVPDSDYLRMDPASRRGLTYRQIHGLKLW